MAKSKKTTKKQDDAPMFGLRAWLSGLVSRSWIAGRIATALIAVGLLVAWIIGLETLRKSVAASSMELVQIDFAWPAGDRRERSWLFPEVQHELHQLAAANISPDPFNQQSLDQAANALDATGWFADGLSIRRVTDGRVEIDGSWRTPAAVVSKDGREWLVDMDGVPLRLPPGTVTPARFFRIYDPASQPPRDSEGSVRYGTRWDTDDVRDAIALLWQIVSEAETASRAILGVDLGEYQRTGHLVLLTDTGCSIVWGGPIGSSKPGEASTIDRLAHLAKTLHPDARLDRGVSRIDLHIGGYTFKAPNGDDDASGAPRRNTGRKPLP